MDINSALLLTEIEAAKLLAICGKSLANLRKRGGIAFVQLGRSIRYDRASLTEWIEGCKRIGPVTAIA